MPLPSHPSLPSFFFWSCTLIPLDRMPFPEMPPPSLGSFSAIIFIIVDYNQPAPSLAKQRERRRVISFLCYYYLFFLFANRLTKCREVLPQLQRKETFLRFGDPTPPKFPLRPAFCHHAPASNLQSPSRRLLSESPMALAVAIGLE